MSRHLRSKIRYGPFQEIRVNQIGRLFPELLFLKELELSKPLEIQPRQLMRPINVFGIFLDGYMPKLVKAHALKKGNVVIVQTKVGLEHLNVDQEFNLLINLLE